MIRFRFAIIRHAVAIDAMLTLLHYVIMLPPLIMPPHVQPAPRRNARSERRQCYATMRGL